MKPRRRAAPARLVACLAAAWLTWGCSPARAPSGAHAPLAIRAAPGSGERFGLYRNYFALERIGPVAHHFAADFDAQRSSCHVLAFDDGAVSVEGCMAPGVVMQGPPPPDPSALPPPASIVRAVESALRKEYPPGSKFNLKYGGRYCDLTLSEIIMFDGGSTPSTPSTPNGWSSRIFLHADEGLTRASGASLDRLGFGVIDGPAAPAAKVALVLPSHEGGQRLLTAGIAAAPDLGALLAKDPSARSLVEGALAAARKIAAGEAVPAFGPQLFAPADPTPPPGYDPHVVAVLSAVPHTPFVSHELPLPLRLRLGEALGPGGARASFEGEIDGVRVRASATLSATRPAPPPAAVHGVNLTLALHVEDDRGNAADRDYAVWGLIDARGPAPVLPLGYLLLPSGGSVVLEAPSANATMPLTVRLDGPLLQTLAPTAIELGRLLREAEQ